jgi:autotransporter-associated beta strand protein
MFRCHQVIRIVTVILSLYFASTVQADTNWILPSGQAGDWSVSENWNSGVPKAHVTAIVGNGGTATIDSPGQACLHLFLGYNTSSGTVQMTAGSLVTTGDTSDYAALQVGVNTAGTFIQSGGTNTIVNSGPSSSYLVVGRNRNATGLYVLSGTAELSAPWEIVGEWTSGTIRQSGGTNTITTPGVSLSLGGYNNGKGTYELSGGLVSMPNETLGNGQGSKGIFKQSGGTNSVLGSLSVGYGSEYFPDVTGTYDLSGGLLQASGEEIARSGTGVFTQTGGTNSTGLLSFASNSGSSGTYNLNGGTLIINSISKGAGTAFFNFGGGTLKAGTTFTTSLPMSLSNTAGNANVDTTNGDITLSGTLSGIGGLNKLGANILTLGAASTYTGPTTIKAGILALSSTGSLNSSSINVSAGATYNVSAISNGYHLKNSQTLGGTGTVTGNVTVDAGGQIAPGNIPGSLGTLTFNDNLSLASGSVLYFDLATSNASDKISMPSSTLLLNNQQFSDFNFAFQNGISPGIYTLIAAGSVQGGLGSNVSGTINGLAASISTSGNSLLLTVVPEPSILVLLGVSGVGCFGLALRRWKLEA